MCIGGLKDVANVKLNKCIKSNKKKIDKPKDRGKTIHWYKPHWLRRWSVCSTQANGNIYAYIKINHKYTHAIVNRQKMQTDR